MEYQVDVGSAQDIDSPNFLLLSHQTAAKIGVPSKANNIAIFANLNARKNFIDIDGFWYRRDAVSIDYASNDYLNQCRSLEIFCKECLGEELLSLFMNYADMKNIHPFQVIDLKF